MKDTKFIFHLNDGRTFTVHASDLEAAIYHFFFYYREFRLDLSKVVGEGKTYESVGASVSYREEQKYKS